MSNMIPLEHPGAILLEEFIEPLGLTPYKVAKEIGIQQTALGEILKGKRGISIYVGLKLAKFFGMSEEYFVKLQMQYDLDKAKKSKNSSIGKIIPFRPKGRKPSEVEELQEA
ncbi:HigA family addiction module antitoxin [Desulfopila aestuarii]|uniref:Addiction module antidote protein, HigA family n=1 Tax=Desulfopila aestuarii DSM 18488 TaxID=1121416 RepID=A0A1M7YH13_9BACT|nr:HigA family addiction module antitoxin [Desulfopila aestuarii]SHO51910.1 addiction module antidote protein, HigA family [Desulfopila aestuarii DSM 18488]